MLWGVIWSRYVPCRQPDNPTPVGLELTQNVFANVARRNTRKVAGVSFCV